MPAAERTGVTAVVLAFGRLETTMRILDRLDADEAIDEVLVVDGGEAGIADAANRREGSKARGILTGDLGAAGRNVGVEQAAHPYVLQVDDDSYPLPGAVGKLVRVLESSPRVGVAGGLVRNTDMDGVPFAEERYLGSFDWWLRAGQEGPPPPEGFPAFFFPEGGALFRREAYLEAGGFFLPYFFASSEIDFATRLVAKGWEVRYQPDAVFDHLRPRAGTIEDNHFALKQRIRNHVWYFCLRFPPGLAARRIPAYLAFDLLECVARGEVPAWVQGVKEAWTERDRVRGMREPLPREVLRRAERNRGRRHLVWLAAQVRAKLAGI